MCTESRTCRKTVTRHIWSDYLEQAEDIRHSPQGKESYTLRSQTIERVMEPVHNGKEPLFGNSQIGVL